MTDNRPGGGEPDLAAENARFAAELFAGIDRMDVGELSGGIFDMASAGTRRLRDEERTSDLRRARRRRSDAGVNVATLTELDGVLYWSIGGARPSRQPLRYELVATTPDKAVVRRRAARRVERSEPRRGFRALGHIRFTDLPPNEVGRFLQGLDGKLTPNQGLREVVAPGTVGDVDVAPPASGRVLLFVHGTFSNVENVLSEIGSTAAGRRFLGRVLDGSGPYSRVLAYNHPTLSVSPILNAVTLRQHFRGSTAAVDIITHSRGGLVTRWWREAFDLKPAPQGKTIFLGSPLAGTGLAAPANLKHACDMLTNIARALTTAATTAKYAFPIATPLSEAVAALMSLFGTVTKVAAKTPIIDAGVALVPGLAGQSRESANAEILRLRESFGGVPLVAESRELLDSYYFVQSDFQPEDPGWKFWRLFRGFKERLADLGADVIFQGENDLVVDTSR